MEPLDEEVFKAGITDSTAALVDADVAAGNCAFGGSGDCENALDYHLWALALALLLNTRYKVRPVHLIEQFVRRDKPLQTAQAGTQAEAQERGVEGDGDAVGPGDLLQKGACG